MTDVRPPNRPRAVMLFGPSGSGKTPLGQALSELSLPDLQFRHLDFGACLRRAAADPAWIPNLTDRETQAIRDSLTYGTLLEAEHMGLVRKIRNRVVTHSCSTERDCWILNGIPRHRNQAEWVDSAFTPSGILILQCPVRTAMARIQRNAGGDRTGRTDDDTESIRFRHSRYLERTRPLLAWYRARNLPVWTLPVSVRSTPQHMAGAWMQTDPVSVIRSTPAGLD